MGKRLHLTIAEPCQENWDGMTPVEKGKFCGACQKQVVDYSNMSDRQVAGFFKKPIQGFSKGGSVCGRFMSDQLDRPIEIPRKRIPWVKYFFQITLPAFLFSMKVSAQKTKGTVKIVTKDITIKPVANNDLMVGMVAKRIDTKPVTCDTIVKPVKEPIESIKEELKVNVIPDTPIALLMGTIYINKEIGKTPIPVQAAKKEIEGIVVDENNMPVSFATIETGVPGEGMMTDGNGCFTIRKSWFSKGKVLTFSSAGFEKMQIIAGEEQYVEGKLFVQMKSNVVLPEIVVTAKGGLLMGKIRMGGVRRITKEEFILREKDTAITFTKLKLPVEENSILVYPNPVQSGTTFKLNVNKLDEGYYHLQILNQSGQMVQQKEIWFDAEAILLNVDAPAVAAGSYFLVLNNKKTGKKFTVKIIIQGHL